MSGNPDRVLIAVPEHVTHIGPDDGSDCTLCKFYRNGYWCAVDSMLDHSRREWESGYDSGKSMGKLVANRETEDTIKFFATCVIVGLLIGLFLRVIVDKELDKELAKQAGAPNG